MKNYIEQKLNTKYKSIYFGGFVKNLEDFQTEYDEDVFLENVGCKLNEFKNVSDIQNKELFQKIIQIMENKEKEIFRLYDQEKILFKDGETKKMSFNIEKKDNKNYLILEERMV